MRGIVSILAGMALVAVVWGAAATWGKQTATSTETNVASKVSSSIQGIQ